MDSAYQEENIETFPIRPVGGPAAVSLTDASEGEGGNRDPCHPVGKLSLTNVSNRDP